MTAPFGSLQLVHPQSLSDLFEHGGNKATCQPLMKALKNKINLR